MALHSASVLLTLFAIANADIVKSRWEECLTNLGRKRRGNTRGNMRAKKKKGLNSESACLHNKPCINPGLRLLVAVILVFDTLELPCHTPFVNKDTFSLLNSRFSQ